MYMPCVLYWSAAGTKTGFANAKTGGKRQIGHSDSRYQRLTASNAFINPLVPETGEVWLPNHRALEILLCDMPGLANCYQGQFCNSCWRDKAYGDSKGQVSVCFLKRRQVLCRMLLPFLFLEIKLKTLCLGGDISNKVKSGGFAQTTGPEIN